jgi:hypothetical protein
LRQYCKNNNSNNNNNNNISNNSNNNNSNNNNNNNNNIKDKKNKENKQYSIITLHPGQVRNFHFPSKLDEKILQIRKFEPKKSDLRSGDNSPKERNFGENDNSGFCDDDDDDDDDSEGEEEGEREKE